MHRLPLIDTSLRNLSVLLCNAIGCLLLCGLFYFVCARTAFPMTIDVIWQLIVTEISLRRTRRGLIRYLDRTSAGREAQKVCKEQDLAFPFPNAYDDPIIDTMGVVVGWREDEELFEECIRSYKAAQGCKCLIVGVDGDSAEDMVMINTYEKVYSDSPLVIHFERPLGEILESYESDSTGNLLDKECNTDSLQLLCHYVKNMLEEQLFPGSLEGTRHICIYQPHRSKKDILFSAFVVSLIVGENLGIKYVWGSDSDTVVFPDSIQKTVRLIHADKQAGGASARLNMVNKKPTIVSKMIAAKYWFDQDVIREQTAACKASECQPGPCAAFRLISLKEMIVPWYQQIIFGKRMIANEDRHLTTNLLHKGWNVHYAPDAFVLTDAPSTVLQWVKQQVRMVRWGRGTHIERLERPIIYVRKCPLFFFHVWKEEVLPLFAGYYITEYLIHGQMSFDMSGTDLTTRVLLQFVYTLLRSYEPVSWDHIVWLLPSLLFHYLSGPGIQLWSLFTVFESSWGTTMRGAVAPPMKENVRERWYQVGFHVIWMTVLVGFCAKHVSTLLALYTGLNISVWFLPGSMAISGSLIYWSIFWDLHVTRK